jgi:lysophospholipase L1-like esterase
MERQRRFAASPETDDGNFARAWERSVILWKRCGEMKRDTRSGAIPLIANLLLSVVASVITVSGLLLLDLMMTSMVGGTDAIDGPIDKLRVPVREFHHGLGTNIRVEEGWGDKKHLVFTNSLGMRDETNRKVAPKAHQKRVLLIGDSFTEGVGVAYEHSFAGLVGKSLEAKNIETLNAGVAGYSSIIYWRRVKHLIEELNIDVDRVIVMLDISDIYDAGIYTLNADGNVTKAKLLKRVQEYIEQRTTICRIVVRYLYSHYERFQYWRIKGNGTSDGTSSLAINHYYALWTVDSNIFEAYGRSGLENEDRYLSMLAKLLDARRIPLTVTVYPWPDQIWYNDRNSRHVTYWKEWSIRNNVEFIDLFPSFFNLNPDNPRLTIEQYYIEGDVHWNARGHQLVAKELLKRIEDWQDR